MKPEANATRLMAVASAKAKLWEYGVPEAEHIQIKESPTKLLDLAIAALGDFAAGVNGEPAGELDEAEPGSTLRFASRFFDTLVQSRIAAQLDDYSTLCAAACYYLAEMPGNSSVLTTLLGSQALDLTAGGLDRALHAMLLDDPSVVSGYGWPRFGSILNQLFTAYDRFRRGLAGPDTTIRAAEALRALAYKTGSPREVLLADVTAAVTRMRVDSSVWTCLPKYSGLTATRWLEAASKSTFIREFWPAQKLLGDADVFRGQSAVIQMPTSAGKTKATELTIRSAFLAGRTSLAVVVAPFRALCHEISRDLRRTFAGEDTIVDELSDVMQADFGGEPVTGPTRVLVVTPEKLHYVLRQIPTLAGAIGLVIYDEGHLFDDTSRGVNYELLVSAIKRELPPNAQVLLISAVVPNAGAIRDWLIGKDGESISGIQLSPTYRRVAFASWLDRNGRLEFTEPGSPVRSEFFVPRVLEQVDLHLLGKERTQRQFPEKDDPKDLALSLGLKVVVNGSVAIFCGRRDVASAICARAVECAVRGLETAWPSAKCDVRELAALVRQHEKNLGAGSNPTKCASLGIFLHHGGVPHGIRLTVEHAMQARLISFVVCTSTLAQGVNLPVRYLVVAGVYQGRDRVRVRDFQNLMGRVGRAGMFTEGTILFADRRIFDGRTSRRERWRWATAAELLDPNNAEACSSAIRDVLEAFRDTNGTTVSGSGGLSWISQFLEGAQSALELSRAIAAANPNLEESDVAEQIEARVPAIRAIQSFLLAHSSEWLKADGLLTTDSLAEATLAYAMATEEERPSILALFRLIAQDLANRVPESPRRSTFGRTLLGVSQCLAIEAWVAEKLDLLAACSTQEALLEALWPLLSSLVSNRTFQRCSPPQAMLPLAEAWIRGEAFFEILGAHPQVRVGRGTHSREFTLGHLIEVCEGALGFDGSLLVGAVREVLGLLTPGRFLVSAMLQLLQKQLKYGLPGELQIALYELGFVDRPLAQELSQVISNAEPSKAGVASALKAVLPDARQVVSEYPSLFSEQLEML